MKGTLWNLSPSGYVCFFTILPLLLFPSAFKLIFSTDDILRRHEIYVFPERCGSSFSFQCGVSKIMGNMLATLKQKCIGSLGTGMPCVQCFLQTSENITSSFFQSVSEAKETMGRVHKSLHRSMRSCGTRTSCLNGT